jgi:hypothetical protein
MLCKTVSIAPVRQPVCRLQTVLPRQRLLEDVEQREAVLRYIPCEETRAAVRDEWARRPQSATDDVNLDRWAALEQACEAVSSFCIAKLDRRHGVK